MSTASSQATSAKTEFLQVYDREHETTMRVLRAFPADKADMQPHAKCRTARDLAWVFVAERGLGMAVYQNQLEELMAGEMPEPPQSWEELLSAFENAHRQFRDMIEATTDADLQQPVTFFVGPHKMGQMTRLEWIRFLLRDEIHHRGQFSIYLRMADATVPSIYGPTADEPWM